MKKVILLLTTAFIMSSSFAQNTKIKENGEKTKVSEDKVKTKDAEGNKTKIKAPAPVIKSFMNDYPDVKSANWSASRGNWSANYTVEGMQTTTTYNANGTRVNTRTMYPLDHLPDVIVTYQQNTPALKVGKVYKVNTPDQDDVYEVVSADGKTVYIDSNGNETKYTPKQ